MSEIVSQLTPYLNQYGLWVLAISIVLQCNGFPTGANFMVIASGTLLAMGELALVPLALTVLLANIAGDLSCYFLWKYMGSRIFEHFPSVKERLDRKIDRTSEAFERYGFLAVVITRFPASALAVVMNIVAGTARCRLSCFAPAVIFGETLWTIFYVGFGYWFGDSWEETYSLISQFSMWLILGLGAAAAIYLTVKQIKKTRLAQLY
ncbi:MAG: DedA family protein [Deltaproteobacteria bacterium]